MILRPKPKMNIKVNKSGAKVSPKRAKYTA